MAEQEPAEQDSAKRGQVSEMNPRQPSESIPLPGPPGLPGESMMPEPGAILEADLQAHIGRQLRAVYDEVVNEPVPDRFLRLLEELDGKKVPRA